MVNASYDLTPTQRSIWIGQKLYPAEPLYNMAFLFDFGGPLEVGRFKAAFRKLIENHEAMRAVIFEEQNEPRQAFQDFVEFDVEIHDFSGHPEPLGRARSWAESRCREKLDLGVRLFDAALLKVRPQTYVFYFNQHHLVNDAWSTTLVLKYLNCYYAGQEAEAGDLRHYLATQPGCAKPAARRKSEPLNVFGSPHRPGPASVRLTRTLGSVRLGKLLELAARPEIRGITTDFTLFTIFAGFLVAYLGRLAGPGELEIGTPTHGRLTPSDKNTLGLFVELIPLAIEFEPRENFASLLSKIRNVSLQGLRGARGQASSGSPSFNTVLNYLNVTFDDFDGRALRSSWLHPGSGDPNHHLRLEVHRWDDDEFTLHFDMNSDVFPEHRRENVIEQFLALIDAVLEDPERALETIAILSGTERDRVLEYSQHNRGLDRPRSLISAFEEQVRRHPQRSAVRCPGRSLSYQELQERSRSLAGRLGRAGLEPGEMVGIQLDRTVDMPIAILAVLYAGCAYVPLDSAHPLARRSTILEDAGVRLLIASEDVDFPQDVVEVIRPHEEGPFTERDIDPESPAYALYTSGSTGVPKAAVIEHQGVVALVESLRTRVYQGLGEALQVALVAPYVFDPSVQQIFGALLQGHTLHLLPEEARLEGTLLAEFLRENQIDVADGTPVHLELLLQSSGEIPVRRFLIGGEALSGSVLRRFRQRFPESKISNVYGVAECSVDSLCLNTEEREDWSESVPLGHPLPNSRVYILNSGLRLQPFGVGGEICLAGPGVGRGYLNRPELSAEKFVDNPLRPGERLYRTGDRGRLNEDGLFEFLGRQDRQIQLRGYRIELGEIENTMMGYREVVSKPAPFPQNRPRCLRCLLSEAHPGTRLDQDGVCNLCREFEELGGLAADYFRDEEEFQRLARSTRERANGEYDCLLLYSGGKDSSYVLYRLVELGLRVLAFTFDNGFISRAAMDNVSRQTERLGVESIVARTDHMDEIFVSSLEQDQTVCSGCFKALTTISTRLAADRGIPMVVTGLSRGQIYDTKLQGLYREGIIDPREVEEKLALFRRLFHAHRDPAARLLGDDLGDVDFGAIEFVDYFRYDRTPVNAIRAYLEERDSHWKKPQDTGFCSSNCLMNDVGICVHSRERGYHNYAAPLSWDIRLGISSREEVLPEVESVPDLKRVERILKKIGYYERGVKEAAVVVRRDESGRRTLCGYYSGSPSLSEAGLREHLLSRLPIYMVPSKLVALDTLPRTHNGKIDRWALPAPTSSRPDLKQSFSPPVNATQTALAEVWAEVLELQRVGIHDNFFDLGGDSIAAIRVTAGARRRGLSLAPTQLFDHQTVAELAAVVAGGAAARSEQGAVEGRVGLTPIQSWFLSKPENRPDSWYHSVELELPDGADRDRLSRALTRLASHHDALRITFHHEGSDWVQHNRKDLDGLPLHELEFTAADEMHQRLEGLAPPEELRLDEDLVGGYLVRLPDRRRLILFAHHLVVDGMSWLTLIEDLDRLLRDPEAGLPRKTTSFQTWAQRLSQFNAEDELRYWRGQRSGTEFPRDLAGQSFGTEESAAGVINRLSSETTHELLQRAPQRFNCGVRELLLTALMMAFKNWKSVTECLVAVEGNGRDPILSEVDLSRTVGWFTALYPVRLRLRSGEPTEAFHQVRKQLKSVPRGGIGYGVLRYLNGHDELADDPPVLFNYMGRLGQLRVKGGGLEATRALRLTRDLKAPRSFLLEVNALVVEDCLETTFGYSRECHQRSSIEGLALEFEKAVSALLSAGGSTEFPLARLNSRKKVQLAAALRRVDGKR